MVRIGSLLGAIVEVDLSPMSSLVIIGGRFSMVLDVFKLLLPKFG